MRSRFWSILVGMAILGITATAPSEAEARPWHHPHYHHYWHPPRVWTYYYYWWVPPRAWVYYYPVPTYYYYPYPVAYSSPSPVYGEDATSLYSNSSLPPAGSASSSNYGNPAQESLPAPQPDTEETKVSKLLTAIGVPNNNGHLRWPVGLRDLGGPDSGHEADELREQLDALFQVAAEQAVHGPLNPKLFQEITGALDKLRKLLIRDREERSGLPQADYDEAERFLDKLNLAAQKLRDGLKS